MNELAAYEWLVRDGHKIIERAFENVEPNASASTRVDWSQFRLDDWQRAMLEQQLHFSQRSRHRFPNARSWLWTDRAAQQASDWYSAVYKASLFPAGLNVIDGCCGIGADLVALSKEHPTLAIDRDPIMLLLARANVESHGLTCDTLCAELPAAVLSGAVPDFSACGLHMDPDRRVGEQRTTWGDAFSPSLAECIQLSEQACAAVIKLAPATEIVPELEQQLATDWRRVWLGTARECPQQLLIRGKVTLKINDGEVAAVLVGREEGPVVFSGQPNADCPIDDQPQSYMMEPHPALYAAGLASGWADNLGLAALAQLRGYYTGDAAHQSVWCQCFRVLDSFGWDERRLRKWLNSYGAGIVEFKCRLAVLDASGLQRKFSRPEGRAVTCLITQVGKSVRVIVGERIDAVAEGE